MQLIIPMSGMGNRFLEAGYKDPKPLIEVDGIPIIQHVVNLFPGIDDVIFICNFKHIKETKMKDILKSICPKSKIIEKEYTKKGPVEAIMHASNYINDDSEIIVSYCDYGSVWNFENFLEDARKNFSDGAIACYTGFHPHMLGSDKYAFCKHENNFLLEIKEKENFTSNKMEEYASNGTYYFRTGKLLKKYFTELIEKDIHVNGEYYVSLVYNLLVRDNKVVRIFEIEKMLQWGTPKDMENYNYWSNYFKNKKNQNNIEIENLNNVTTIIPMAGKGSRFSEVGYDKPKPMIEVDGSPMVIQAVNCLPKSNKHVFICLQSHIKDHNIDFILNKNYENVNVIPIQDTTDGQASTCKIGIDFSSIEGDDPILISACDNGVYYNAKKYEEVLNDESIDVIVWSFRNNQTTKNNPDMYSYLNVDVDGSIKEVSVKKLKYGDALKTHAIIGTMFFRKAKYFLDGYQVNKNRNIKTNGEFYVDDVINRCIESGLKVKVFEVDYYICWGTPDDYKTYNYWKNYFSKK